MRSLTRHSILLLAVSMPLGLLSTLGCSGDGESVWPDKPGPKVLVSFPPLYSFAASIGGDHVNVVSMLTSHGPHGYETTPRDARLVKEADVFLLNGLGLDDFIPRELKRSANPDLRIVELGKEINENTLAGMDGHHHHHGDDGHTHVHEGEYDPHVWLGIDEAKGLVRGVRKALSEVDPDHAEEFLQNSRDYIAMLEQLQRDGLAMLEGIDNRKLVTFHESLTYFGRSFNLHIVGAIQVSGGVEASGDRMKQIVDQCVEQDVRVIAVEPQYSKQTAEQIVEALKLKGVDAVIVEIDPLETADPAELSPDFYEEKMRQNLENLVEALK